MRVEIHAKRVLCEWYRCVSYPYSTGFGRYLRTGRAAILRASKQVRLKGAALYTFTYGIRHSTMYYPRIPGIRHRYTFTYGIRHSTWSIPI